MLTLWQKSSPLLMGTPGWSLPTLSSPFPVHTPHSVLQTHCLAFLSKIIPFCPGSLQTLIFFFFFSVTSPSTFLLPGGPSPLLLPAFGDDKHRPLAENMSFSVTSKTVWVSGRRSRRNQWGVFRYSGTRCPPISVHMHGRRGLERAEPAAGCHGHFITHLLIVANGDFTPPPALIVAAALL